MHKDFIRAIDDFWTSMQTLMKGRVPSRSYKDYRAAYKDYRAAYETLLVDYNKSFAAVEANDHSDERILRKLLNRFEERTWLLNSRIKLLDSYTACAVDANETTLPKDSSCVIAIHERCNEALAFKGKSA